MQKKYSVLLFSDFPLPSYRKPHRNVLFVDYAPKDKFKEVYLISPEPKEEFKNKNIKLIVDYYKISGDFYKTQHDLFLRLFGIFKLFLRLVNFRIKNNKKIDFIRTGSTYLSVLVSLTQTKSTVFIGDVCDFYYELYEEFNMPLAKLLKPLIFFFEKKAINRMNLIFVDTGAQRNFLVRKMKIDPRKCTVLPNGINSDLFPFKKEKDEQLMRKYGFTKKDKILFYSGDISRMDGIDNIVKFLVKRKNCKALVIGKGEGKYLKYLEELRSKNDLGKRLIVDGFKPYEDVHKYTSLADVCLAPFRITNTSNTVECAKIITYLLMGKQVLATEAEGLKTLYKSNISYFLDGSFTDFSAKLDELLFSNGTLKKQKELAELGKKFDFKKIIEYEYKVIEKYLENPNQDFTKYDYL